MTQTDVGDEEVAPDGSRVQPLGRCDAASAAEFRLAAGAVTRAVRHRVVSEIWRVVAGRGRLCNRRGPLPLHGGSTAGLGLGVTFYFLVVLYAGGL